MEDTIKDRNATKPPNVLTGDANAGRAYFNGAGKCSTCHSATGDMAGIGKRYDGITLQQRFLFPRQGGRGTPPAKPIEVTVTPASGPGGLGNAGPHRRFQCFSKGRFGPVSFLDSASRI